MLTHFTSAISAPVLALSLLSTACSDSNSEHVAADVVTELPAGRGIAAVGEEIFFNGDDGVQACSPSSSMTGILRQVVDARYRACPWKNPWRTAGEVEDVRVTYVGRVAYVHQRLCGLWTVSLDDPTKVTPIIQINGSAIAEGTTNARWGDGTQARVDPVFDISVAADGKNGNGAVLCLSTGDDLELWIVGDDGKPRERLAKSDAINCEEVIQAGGAIFFSATVGGLNRFDRATGTLSRFHVNGNDTLPARSLTASSSHLFYLDVGAAIHRVGLDGKGHTKIDRPVDPLGGTPYVGGPVFGPPVHLDWTASLVATNDQVFLATETRIVRIPRLDGPIETVLERDLSWGRIAPEHGLAKIGDDLWFLLSVGKKLQLARLSLTP
jgi:hypothetical protein